MSASLRFLTIAVIGWAGVRAATLGSVAGAEVFSFERGSARPTPTMASASASGSLPEIVPTEFPQIDPPPPGESEAPVEPAPPPPGMAAAHFKHAALPSPRFERFYYMPASAPGAPATVELAALPRPARALTAIAPEPQPLFYSPIPQLDDWPLSRLASAAMPPRRSAVTPDLQSVPQILAQRRIDRLQLTAWALLRGRQGLIAGPNSLASGGQLGGSQAGARLTYNISPLLGLSLRSSSPVGSRGGEVAGGVRITPFRSIPISLTAERRHAIGRFGGGRSAFALFLEGGVYQRPIAWGFNLDAYLQGGVVGARRRDLFVDGAATLSRPIYGPFSGGFGVWGGAQPGLYRVDAGPRVTMKVRNSMRVHLDWRQRVAGNAAPGSGPAVTLAADF